MLSTRSAEATGGLMSDRRNTDVYEAPALVVIGSLEDLTLQQGTFGTDPGALGGT
jgi:hypothetical protein